MEDRLITIESKLTLAEDMLDTLNATVYRQQAQIDSLQQQIRLLYAQMQAGEGGESPARRDLREEIPPHY